MLCNYVVVYECHIIGDNIKQFAEDVITRVKNCVGSWSEHDNDGIIKVADSFYEYFLDNIDIAIENFDQDKDNRSTSDFQSQGEIESTHEFGGGKMYILSNDGDFECNSIEEYKNILKRCFENENGNEIWCSIHSNEEFPCLSILTGKVGASITYFSENNDEQYVSIGTREREGMEQFLGGQYEVERCQIISYEDAMVCAMEFFETQQRPNNIEWDALFE